MMNSKKRALICGISGQDGSYLARLLIENGYEVAGTSRDIHSADFRNLRILDIYDKVRLFSMSPKDFRSVYDVISSFRPHEIYNLSGQSSVGLSFEQPVETMESHIIGTLNILECIRLVDKDIKFYNACSGECFGDTWDSPADENTPFRPKSPYAVAKSTAFWETALYREAYGLWACSGILFNHESPLRPERFVTKKIVKNACRIYHGEQVKITLGNIKIKRDWGWAPEYVYAMWLMLQQDKPQDFVIATGEPNSLEDFISETFSILGLDWKKHIDIDESLFRPLDISISYGNPKKAENVLNWKPRYKMKDVVRMMLEEELRMMKGEKLKYVLYSD